MDIEREALLQGAVGTGAVVVFITLVAAVGAAYDNQGLQETGALAVVGVIVLFVVLLTVLGLVLGERMGG